jgi:hypothetical protein
MHLVMFTTEYLAETEYSVGFGSVSLKALYQPSQATFGPDSTWRCDQMIGMLGATECKMKYTISNP